jgi:type VI secretion system protein ImpJ
VTLRAVHWHEGMFLRPHHLQAADRYWSARTQISAQWTLYHNWGLWRVELDHDALANFRLVVRSLHARLRDGTLVRVPEDGNLPVVDLKPALAGAANLTAYVAVPLMTQGRANVALAPPADGARYLVDEQQIEDENSGANPQSIQVRVLQLKLLLSNQDHAGYEVLPIARIEKAAKAEATPQLDITYIPPLLSCDAWPPLVSGIVQSVYDHLGKKIEVLAAQVESRGITFDSQTQGDPLTLAQLQALNEAYAVLPLLAFTPGMHPLAVYAELCRLVGQLAIFGPTHRVPPLPRYDHDDLGGCFYAVRRQLDGLLDAFIEPQYKERPFIGVGLRLQVDLEPAWVESSWQLYIGVSSPLETEACVRLLTRGQLDIKVSSSDRVDAVFRLGEAGLRLAPVSRPPRALPLRPGLVYFQIQRDSQPQEWARVQQSLTLAVRLNENLVAGTIQGQHTLMVQTGGGQTTPLQFTLFVLRSES